MNSPFIIAEAGVNHNGDPALAHELVKIAADSGADAVKFQTFVAKELAVPQTPKARYQIDRSGDSQSQTDMLRDLELPRSVHHDLKAQCDELSIEFMSTPFDVDSLEFLVSDVGMTRIKIPSGEVTNPLLLLEAAASGLDLVMSTGMCENWDIEWALGVLAFGIGMPSDEPPTSGAFEAAFADPLRREMLSERVVLLHCTSAYPAQIDDVNLATLPMMREHFGLPVGYSDHTMGLSVPLAATALGATVIEKHFTRDRALPGPDHAASLEPDELAAMVRGIGEVAHSIGRAEKRPVDQEIENRALIRRSIVATTRIAANEPFTTQNIALKRPGTGIDARKYWDMVGSLSKRSYAPEDQIEE